ncbi:MAG TPA: hypothetical protein VMF31_09125 [Solirubrobacterales bacterium]|nr:hypothetical protein [Solirubrobacterales bacterium]
MIDQKALSGRLVRLSAGLAVIVLFALLPGIASAAFPGENGLITYGSFVEEEGTSQIFVANPDGSGVRQVTPSGTGRDVFSPAIGPDSKQVVYVAFDSTLPEESDPIQLRIVNTDGTGDRQLTSGPLASMDPSFYPSGDRVIFVRQSGSSDFLWTVKTDGTELTQSNIEGCCLSYPIVAPNSLMKAWISRSGLTVHQEGQPAPPLVVAPEAFGKPSFSPDGSRIAFESGPVIEDQVEILPRGIQSIEPNGDRRLEVAAGQDFEPRSPAYSPDGKSIGYISARLQGRRGSPAGRPSPQATTPADFGVNIGDLTSGTSRLVDLPQENFEDLDWGNREVQPPPPPECKLRFSRARFFVFKRKPVYRLVARYWSNFSGDVQISFYRRDADGGRGASMGSLTRSFEGEGRFRVRKRVTPALAKKLRRSEHGFVADVKIKEKPDFCSLDYSVNLTDLRRVKKQFVWFQAAE